MRIGSDLARAVIVALLVIGASACDDCGFLISTNTLPDAFIAHPYSSLLVVHCGSDDEWVLVSGSLPPGVALQQNGALVGVPTAVGTFDFTVAAVDRDSGDRAERGLSITVFSGP